MSIVQPMVRLHNASKTFNRGTVNEVRPLQDINLEISNGEFVVVLGGNGSGKSTLLNAIAGSFMMDAGRIELDGQDVTDWPEHRRAALIGRVFQNPFSGTAPSMTIAENFALAMRRGLFRGLGWATSAQRMDELRDRVRGLRMGLENRLDTAIGSLSGGQRQALTLLMATWLKPRLLLLDEHTAALDPSSADQVIALTRQIIEQQGQTTLMVTHSMQQAVNLGNRIIMMHRGCVRHDFDSEQKVRLTADDLLSAFEDVLYQDLPGEHIP